MNKLTNEQIELYNAELDRLSEEELTKEILDKQAAIAHILCQHYRGERIEELVEPIHPSQKKFKKISCEAEDTCRSDCEECLFGNNEDHENERNI